MGNPRPIDIYMLLKPRILFAFIAIFVLSYIIAKRGPSFDQAFVTGSIGLVFAIAGANVLNNYFDRDIDSIMLRTRRRPIPSGRIEPGQALMIGVVLSTFALTISLILGLMAVILFALGMASYIFLYTLMAKRRSVLGVLATAPAVVAPGLFGWWLARGGIDIEGIVLGLIMAIWGPLHFWSLATVYSNDYRRAGLPILPLVLGERRSSVLLISLCSSLVASSFLPYLLGNSGEIYLISASVLGSMISIPGALSLIRVRWAWRLFKLTSPYLILLLLSLVIDRLSA